MNNSPFSSHTVTDIFQRVVRRRSIWIVALASFVILATYVHATSSAADPYSVLDAPPAQAAVVTPTATPTQTPTSTSVPAIAMVQTTETPTATSTPPTDPSAADQRTTLLRPAPDAVGWASSGERLNQFGGRNLHAGFFEGNVYHGAIQFRLDSIPPGTELEEVTVELMGLSTENLGDDGTWTLHMLGSDLDEEWTSITYEDLHDAPTVATIPPTLTPEDLGARQQNVFTFTAEQRRELERRLESGLVSFRIDGPASGGNNLFTWDTGFRSGDRPVLRVVYNQAPTPTPAIVVNTPTPANVVTAAAVAATATYEATAVGTATPLPFNFVTATPQIIVTNTPTPENSATAQVMVAEATARAYLYGSPTPLPANVWTATPVPPTPMPTSTPTSTPLPLVVPLEQLETLSTMSPVPTATPSSLPSMLTGKIAFVSDRFGEPETFLVDPDGTNLAWLTDPWAYNRAAFLESFTPDRTQRAFVNESEIWLQDAASGAIEFLTGPGEISYDPAWSPNGTDIAFVSQVNGNDEIFVVDVNNRQEVTQLTQNQWEWDKHPSWSPDGSQIVFWSNRVTGRSQLWIMNADGSNQRPLFEDEWNNWNPVWIK